MAWTAPRTWISAEVVTAAIMNTHVKDNLIDLDSRVGTNVTNIATNTANFSTLNGSNITTGTVATGRLGSGTPSASNFLRGDGTWSSNGSGLTTLNGSNISSGTVAAARLGSGSPSSANFLRGDGSWQIVPATFIVWTALSNQPPSTNYATLDTRNNHAVLDFDDTTDEDAIFGGALNVRYDGGGLTVEIYWGAENATPSGNVVWNAAIERHQEDVTDLDSDSFATANAVTDAAPSASGELVKAAITFTDGADMDNLAAGESFRLKITRDANNGSDTMSDDAELYRVVMRET
jgi:hypothetical protein